MTLKKYELKVKRPEDWDGVLNTLSETSSIENFPNRQVTCFDDKMHSPTRGTFLLHKSEVETLMNDSSIDWIELDPTENPDEYPKPSHYTKRWEKNVKVYRDLNGGGQPVSTGATVGELDRTGWQIVRTGIKTNGDFWGVLSGNISAQPSDASYSLTGKNVDTIIHDSGVLQYHPEFLDSNNRSRVRDIVLDGPYYIDHDYFDANGFTYTKPDGRTGITTTSARNWWNNSSLRSVGFSTIGTISITSGYTEARALGNSLDGSSEMTSGHGTSSASLVAGKNFGLAFEANIWNMSGIGEPAGMGITKEQEYDLMKLFHLYKPINPETGIKNPTLVNGSWGYQSGFESGDSIDYSFRGITGTFIGNDSVSDQVTAMKDGLNNQLQGAYRSWSTSSRSNSIDAAGAEAIDSGLIYVAASGNNNQRLGVGSTDPDRLNYMSDEWFGSTDPRGEFPSGTVPCNHRDWMNPQGLGFDASVDPEFHPVICVGAMDEYVIPSTLSERKADYSNNGPGIDIWSPADETLSAGTNGVANYTDYERYDDSRFYDHYFNGTSAAAPVTSGLLVLYLQSNPKATSREVKTWLKNNGSVIAVPSEYQDEYSDDTQTSYWTGSFNMRGAERRILYNPFANDVVPKIDGLSVTGVNFKLS